MLAEEGEAVPAAALHLGGEQIVDDAVDARLLLHLAPHALLQRLTALQAARRYVPPAGSGYKICVTLKF